MPYDPADIPIVLETTLSLTYKPMLVPDIQIQLSTRTFPTYPYAEVEYAYEFLSFPVPELAHDIQLPLFENPVKFIISTFEFAKLLIQVPDDVFLNTHPVNINVPSVLVAKYKLVEVPVHVMFKFKIVAVVVTEFASVNA